MARPQERCYRCGYVWTPRRQHVRICSRCKSPYYWLPKLSVPAYGGGEGIDEIIGPKRPEVLRIALRCGATDIRVFGSVARHSANPKSDVDFLVRPIPNRRYSPVDLSLELTRLLGRRADVVSEGSLHWLIQPQVLVEAVQL